MAQGETSGADVARQGSQPKMERPKQDLTKASPDAAWASAESAPQPLGDVVAMVSRNKDGEPDQSANFHVLVDDDAPDEIKDAHWNRAGEAQGAKDYDHSKHGAPQELDHEERMNTENKELARIRKGE